MSNKQFVGVAICVLVGIGTAYGVKIQSDRLDAVKIELDNIKKTISDYPRIDEMEMQSRCAREAKSEFEELEKKNKELLSGSKIDLYTFGNYSSHYNHKLKKCFLMTEYAGSLNGAPTENKSLIDAIEKKGYASYAWMNNDGKKYWEVKPYICSAIKVSGEEVSCSSAEEFESLIHEYMND